MHKRAAHPIAAMIASLSLRSKTPAKLWCGQPRARPSDDQTIFPWAPIHPSSNPHLRSAFDLIPRSLSQTVDSAEAPRRTDVKRVYASETLLPPIVLHRPTLPAICSQGHPPHVPGQAPPTADAASSGPSAFLPSRPFSTSPNMARRPCSPSPSPQST